MNTILQQFPLILFTGGGSSGHVTPNLALINKFRAAGWQVIYAGSKNGIEKDIISRLGITYYGIATGKLRRYFSWRTFIEPFVILLGIWQAFKLCYQLKPHILFSKGGFVAFPIVVAAWLNRIPIVVHESDLTPGLANRLSFPFADKICITFEEGKQQIKSKNTVVTGTPIRESLLDGTPSKGKAYCQFTSDDPILLILGGGQGAAIINETVRAVLPKLLETFQVIHLCGKGKVDNSFDQQPRYKQFEYINDELGDLFACSDLVVSRAGANSLYELIRLKKPHILIPLSLRASRGDQIANANHFARYGLSNVLLEENLCGDSLLTMIFQVYKEKNEQCERLQRFSLPDSNQLIYQEIIELSHSNARNEERTN